MDSATSKVTVGTAKLDRVRNKDGPRVMLRGSQRRSQLARLQKSGGN